MSKWVSLGIIAVTAMVFLSGCISSGGGGCGAC